MSRLEAVYRSLATGLNDKTFTQVKMEMKKEDLSLGLQKCTEQDAEQDVTYQGASCSPMEASPADEPAQMDADPQIQTGSVSKTASAARKRRLYTVAQLVVEPDSHGSSQCTPASEELEAEVRTEELPAAVVAEPRSPAFTAPTRITRHSSRIGSESKLLSDNEEEAAASSSSTLAKRLKQAANDSASRTSRIPPSPKQPDPAPKTPPQSRASGSRHVVDADNVDIIDSSLDGSPPALPLPQTSSTPHNKSPPPKVPPESKWKQLFNNATESKETWDEDLSPNVRKDSSRSPNENSLISGRRKQMWTEAETRKLIEGVEKFGTGNWSKIGAYYSFKDRSNVNLKDRWRTLKKTNMV